MSAEIEAPWPNRSNDGPDCPSLKLDDLSFNAPVFVNVFDDEDGENHHPHRS